MKYQVFYTKPAQKDLQNLEPTQAQQIIKKIQVYTSSKDPFHFASRLKGEFDQAYRFRIGEYRALFPKEPHGAVVIIAIIRIAHRKEIYK